MSQRDRDLIKFAGLTVESVAELLGRSRQAIYQGIAAPNRDYFDRLEVVGLFQDARRRQFKYLETLRGFIETEYDPVVAELIDADRIDHARAVHMIEESDEIILGINGSDDVINPRSTFTPTIDAALQLRSSRLCLIVAANWIRDYFLTRIAQLHPGLVSPEELPIEILTNDMMENLPSFCLLSRKGEWQGFWFGISSLDRLTAENATRLWKLVASTILGPSEKDKVAGPFQVLAGKSRSRRRA